MAIDIDQFRAELRHQARRDAAWIAAVLLVVATSAFGYGWWAGGREPAISVVLRSGP